MHLAFAQFNKFRFDRIIMIPTNRDLSIQTYDEVFMVFDFVSEKANCYPNGLWIPRISADTMCTTGGAV
jgi:hypothetical protein